MKTKDKETLETIEQWTGHSDQRLELKVVAFLLALALSVIVSAVAILYFILCILFST
jgi:hypothetical protein